MHYFIHILVVDDDGFILYIDHSFSGSLHYVQRLRSSDLSKNWQILFKVDRSSLCLVEHLLSDPGILAMDHFIL